MESRRRDIAAAGRWRRSLPLAVPQYCWWPDGAMRDRWIGESGDGSTINWSRTC